MPDRELTPRTFGRGSISMDDDRGNSIVRRQLRAAPCLADEAGSRSPTQFKDLEELTHFVAQVMGLCNEIASCFEQDAAAFAPSFYERPSSSAARCS